MSKQSRRPNRANRLPKHTTLRLRAPQADPDTTLDLVQSSVEVAVLSDYARAVEASGVRFSPTIMRYCNAAEFNERMGKTYAFVTGLPLSRDEHPAFGRFMLDIHENGHTVSVGAETFSVSYEFFGFAPEQFLVGWMVRRTSDGSYLSPRDLDAYHDEMAVA